MATSYTDMRDRIPVRKGTISFMDQDESLTIQFMYNPAEVVRNHGFAHGKVAVPGRSHPMYGGGAGNEQSFSFTLQLDADRGNYEHRLRRNPEGGDFQAFDSLMIYDAVRGFLDPTQLENLRPIMDQFHQLVLPDGRSGQPYGAYGVPARIFIDLGSVIRGEIGIDDVQEGIFHYGPQQNILKATLQIKGHIRRHTNVTNSILVEDTFQYITESDRARTEQLARVPRGTYD